jgi:hypothetical protein
MPNVDSNTISNTISDKLFTVEPLSPTRPYTDESLNKLADEDRREGETIEDYIARLDKMSSNELLGVAKKSEVSIPNKRPNTRYDNGSKKRKRSRKSKRKHAKRSKSKHIKRSKSKHRK